jgi:hypothetical protein
LGARTQGSLGGGRDRIDHGTSDRDFSRLKLLSIERCRSSGLRVLDRWPSRGSKSPWATLAFARDLDTVVTTGAIGVGEHRERSARAPSVQPAFGPSDGLGSRRSPTPTASAPSRAPRLTAGEAARRLETTGPNVLVKRPNRAPLDPRPPVREHDDPRALPGRLATIVVGDVKETVLIGVIVVLNAVPLAELATRDRHP